MVLLLYACPAQANSALALAQTGKVGEMLRAFAATPVASAWKDCSQLSQWMDDAAKLIKLVECASQGEQFVPSGEDVECLKAARSQLLHWKSSFYESLALFPLGQYIQQSCGSCVEGYLREQSFKLEIEAMLQSCAAMKTFTCDALFKSDSLDILIPNASKVVDVVQKFTLMNQVASTHFLKHHEEPLHLVKVKILELQTGLNNAIMHKFRKTASTRSSPCSRTWWRTSWIRMERLHCWLASSRRKTSRRSLRRL